MDAGRALGLAAALLAAACYETGYAVQALEARRTPARDALHLSLLGRLVRRRGWLAASALAAAGWPLQIFALAHLPLAVVQPVLALGLVLLLVLGIRLLGEPAGWREGLAAAAIVVGAGVLAWAAPENARATASPLRLALVLGALGAVVLLPYALRAARVRGLAAAMVLAAGAADAWAALAGKLVADHAAAGAWLGALAWALGAGAAFGLGLVSEMSALQQRGATQVGPVVFVMQVVVPVLLSPLLDGEDWGSTPLGGGAIVLGLIAVALGARLLGGTRAVARLAQADAGGGGG